MIKIYENGEVKEEIAENQVDWVSDADYGGAWIGIFMLHMPFRKACGEGYRVPPPNKPE